MTTLTTILAAAALALGLARWRRLPAVPLLIVTGILLDGFGLLPAREVLGDILLLGLAFVVFFVGAELDPRRVGNHRRAALGVGLAQFLLLGIVGLVVTRLAGFDWITALYVALAITASSTLVVVTLLRQRQQFFEPFGRLVVGVLLVQDLLVVLLLPALARATDGVGAITQGVLGTLALVALAGACVRWISPWLLVRMKQDEESTLLIVLAILFMFVGLAHWLALPEVTGAFLAGVALSGFPVRGLVRGQVTSLADFFIALFFVALGGLVSFPGARQVLVESILLAGILLFAPPLVMLIGRRAGLTVRASIEGAHLLAQCGEFGVVVALVGVQQGHIGPNVLAIIVLVAVVTMMLTPLMASDAVTWPMQRLLMRWTSRRGEPPAPAERRHGHIVLLGCGSHMRTVLQKLLARGHEVVVVDEDPDAVAYARRQGAVAIRGEGADYRMLRIARAREARVVVSTMRRMEDNIRLLRFAGGSEPHVLVRVFSSDDGARLEVLGGIPIVESDAGAEAFLQWFDQNMPMPRA